jgi:SAM-dependent methyltransferase
VASRPAGGWEREYVRRGIPSSWRTEPSGALTWMLENWTRAGGAGSGPDRALDVGCGTGRNAIHLAERGARVTAFDSCGQAIRAATSAVAAAGVDVDVRVHDLRTGLPSGDGEIDLVVDTFVYKHQLSSDDRRRYRRDLERVLAPHGRVLVSLAEPTDGYYSRCPPAPGRGDEPVAVVDPATGVGSVLFSLESLVEEMSDALTLVTAWRKAKSGTMHGRRYVRRTLVTVWQARPAPAAG